MDTGGMDAQKRSLIGEIAARVASWEDEREDLKTNIDAEMAAAKDKDVDIVELRKAISNKRKRNKDPEKYDRKATVRLQYELALGMPAYAGILEEPTPSRARAREAEPMGDAVAGALSAYGI